MTKEDGTMTDWRAKINRMLDLIQSERTLHLIYNLIVAIWERGED